MPIKIQSDLPAKEILENENIFVMDESRAIHQDIRPLQVVILNIMPVKQDTELQLLRALSNTPLQVDVTFLNERLKLLMLPNPLFIAASAMVIPSRRSSAARQTRM